MFLIVSRTASGERVRWIATDTLASARRWQAEFLAELDHGTVTIDEADSSAENRRRLYTAWIHRRETIYQTTYIQPLGDMRHVRFWRRTPLLQGMRQSE